MFLTSFTFLISQIPHIILVEVDFGGKRPPPPILIVIKNEEVAISPGQTTKIYGSDPFLQGALP